MLHVDNLFLVARDLTQECHLGADFLCANGCAIDFDAIYIDQCQQEKSLILEFNQSSLLVM